MAVSLDPSGFRAGLPTVPFAMTADAGRGSTALVRAEPLLPSGGGRSRYVIPALLLAGWGGLFAYCAAYLREDLPFRPQPVADAPFGHSDDPHQRIVLPGLEEVPAHDATPLAAPPTERPAQAAVASLPAASAAPPVPPARPAAPTADYVGVWGPTSAACGTPSRRRGYLPAVLTTDRARAGRTVCAFHDGRRAGNAWTLAAECSDRGRRWSSQVRLTVEGDHLTWSSGLGSTSYIRCGRRPG